MLVREREREWKDSPQTKQEEAECRIFLLSLKTPLLFFLNNVLSFCYFDEESE